MRRAFTDLASLAARLGVGGIFFANGWHKLEFGLTATGDQFAKMGASAPGVWAATTMLIELIGGALLVAGLAVPACGLVLFAEALAVFILVSGDTGLPLTGGDVNLIVALGAASVLLAVVGAGRLSVDHLVVIRRREAEAADEMAAEAEADDVIASWRDTARPAKDGDSQDGAPRDAAPAEAEPAGVPKEEDSPTAPLRARPPRERTSKDRAPRAGTKGGAAKAPGRTGDGGTAEAAPTSPDDRLVAGGHKAAAPDNE
ncbi:DoxX family protein [Sphaerisporangium fuscum]|uniref:DoxX family protein n=1 Tax=Sphaerisporangium fuscum TaxID=2835868 RepID=UPI001BDD9395|nr:DoxX family protein [Sphaerisporangium fuscum]